MARFIEFISKRDKSVAIDKDSIFAIEQADELSNVSMRVEKYTAITAISGFCYIVKGEYSKVKAMLEEQENG